MLKIKNSLEVKKIIPNFFENLKFQSKGAGFSLMAYFCKGGALVELGLIKPFLFQAPQERNIGRKWPFMFLQAPSGRNIITDEHLNDFFEEMRNSASMEVDSFGYYLFKKFLLHSWIYYNASLFFNHFIKIHSIK